MSSSAASGASGSSSSGLSARDDKILSHTSLSALQLQAIPAAAAAGVGSSSTTSASSKASLDKLQKTIDAFLPSAKWFTIPVAFDVAAVRVSAFTIQHGAKLHPLQVRCLHEHVLPSTPENAAELDAAVMWLQESILTFSSYPVIGLDCESDCKLESEGEIRLLQLSTGTRALLIRLPDPRAIENYITEQVASRQPIGLFTPLFHQLMRNRSIFKSGAELWTDALDLHARCAGLETNSCLNMSWIFRNEHGGSLSLANMVAHQYGTDAAFLKDKATTTSSWGSPHLSIRQLIYAALDAQTSWCIGANQKQIPRPFHISDCPQSWLRQAATWKAIIRTHEMELDAIRTRNQGRLTSTLKADMWIIDAAKRYLAQSFQCEEPFQPFVSELLSCAFPTYSQALQTIPPPTSDNLYEKGDLVLDPLNIHHYYHSSVEPNFDYSCVDQPFWTQLDATQRGALELTDRSRITGIVGAAGSGRTTLAAAEAARSLSRSTSIILDQASIAVRNAAQRQRVLCVVESDASALVLTAAIAELLPPAKVILFLSHEFIEQWHPVHMPHIRPYVFGLEHAAAAAGGDAASNTTESSASSSDRDVMICTVDFALSTQFPSRLRHRQTVLIDESNQLWLLKAILLLRKLPHTERLILFGDDRQLGAYFGRHDVQSVLSAAHSASLEHYSHVNSTELTMKSNMPLPFRCPSIAVLTHQYRMKPHLAHMLSKLIYDDALQITSTDRSRVIGWVDVSGTPVKHSDAQLGSGFSNQIEINVITHLWNVYAQRPGVTLEHLAIVCMFEAQRREIVAQQETMASRCFTVESFHGQQAAVVFLTLSSTRLTPSLEDIRRVNVACSRAAAKLYIIGDRTGLMSSAASSIWHEIDAYEALSLETVFPELAVDKEMSFPELPSSSASTSILPPPAAVRSTLLADLRSEQLAEQLANEEAAQAQAYDEASFNSQWAQSAPDNLKSHSPPKPQPTRTATAAPAAASSARRATPQPEAPTTPSAAPNALEGRLKQAVSGCLRMTGGVYLNDLEASFLQCHNSAWSEYSDLRLSEFVDQYAQGSPDQRYQRHPNPADASNPFVTLVGQKPPASFPPTVAPASAAMTTAAPKEKPTPAPQAAAPATATPPPAATAVAAPVAAPAASSSSSSAFPTTLDIDPEELARRKQRALEKKQRLAAAKALAEKEAAEAYREKLEEQKAKLTQKALKEKSKEKAKEKSSSAAAAGAEKTAPAAAAAEEEWSEVSGRHASKHPDSLAASIAAELAPAEPSSQRICAFCKAEMEDQMTECPACGADVDEEQRERSTPNDAESDEKSAEQANVEAESKSKELDEASPKSKSSDDSKSKKSSSASSSQAPTSAALEYSADMSESLYCSAADLAEMSQAQKKKLQWLCCDARCQAPNLKSENQCGLCQAKKPQKPRYARPAEQALIAHSTFQASNRTISYESDHVRVAFTNARGFHLVTKQFVKGGTILLRDQTIVSEPRVSNHGGKPSNACVPSPPDVIQIAKHVVADPILSAALAKRHNNGEPAFANPEGIKEVTNAPKAVRSCEQLWNWLVSVMKRPAHGTTSMLHWQHALYYALQSSFEEIPNEHHRTCDCKFGHYKIGRQSSLLESCCWPNCATVYGISGHSACDDRTLIAITDLEAGTVLCEVSPRLGVWEWMCMPRDYRTADLQLEDVGFPRCKCPRCSGHTDPQTGRKIAADHDVLLNAVLDEAYEEDAVEEAYDELIDSWCSVQSSYAEYRVQQMIAKREAAEAAITTDKKPAAKKDAKKKKPLLLERDCSNAAICWWGDAFLFLTLQPLHLCHWRVQQIRRYAVTLIRQSGMAKDPEMWVDEPEEGETEDEAASRKQDGEDAYHRGLLEILHVLRDSIQSNKLFFRECDPCKSIYFLVLEEVRDVLAKAGCVVPSAEENKDMEEKMFDDHEMADYFIDEEYQVPILHYPGIGTKEGQDNFFAALLEYDPGASVLRKLGWPRRERFGAATILNRGEE